jgi:hypothetical protein
MFGEKYVDGRAVARWVDLHLWRARGGIVGRATDAALSLAPAVSELVRWPTRTAAPDVVDVIAVVAALGALAAGRPAAIAL